MANTKLKKKKKGVVGANGLNNDAGTNVRQVWDLLQWGAEPVIQILIIYVL